MPQILREDIRQLLDLIHQQETQASEHQASGHPIPCDTVSGYPEEHAAIVNLVKRIEERLTYLLETTDDATPDATIEDNEGLNLTLENASPFARIARTATIDKKTMKYSCHTTHTTVNNRAC